MSTDAETEAIRDRILAAATDLFLKNGFTGVPVDRIASRTKISKKTIYRIFSSRREIEIGAIDRFVSQVEAAIQSAIAGAKSSTDAFAAFFGVLREQLTGVNFAALSELEFRDPDLWNEIDSRRERIIRDYLGRFVLTGQANGEIRNDLNADFIVGVIVTLILSLATPTRLMASAGGAEAFTRDIATMLLDGIGVRNEH